PPTRRVRRGELMLLARDSGFLQSVLPGRDFPLIVRPVGSHAGSGLEKVDSPDDLALYLQRQSGELFYLAPFVDYACRDRSYRKLRVAFIEGRPFVAHMAISDHWMVHSLNADMAQSAAKRAEEAAMMATFDIYWTRRHAKAIDAL